MFKKISYKDLINFFHLQDLTTTQPQKKKNKHKITILLYISLFIISLYLLTLDRADYRLAPNYSVFYEKTK